MTTQDFINALKEMKVVELNDLVKAIEEEFGVTAAAPVAAGPAADAGGSDEKTVELTSAGGNKIAVIKLVREVLGLGLMEAKKFAEAGGVLKEGIKADEAEELKAKFVEAGAEITIK